MESQAGCHILEFAGREARVASDRYRVDVRCDADERLEHAGGSFVARLAKIRCSGLPSVNCVLRPARDLPSGRGIVPSIEPDIAIADQRARRQMLQPRRPVGPAHGRAQRRGRDAEHILVPQHGDGERGVQRLMAAGQAGQRQFEGALLVAIAELAVRAIASQTPPRGSQGACSSRAISLRASPRRAGRAG